jgi:amino acid transporter
VATEAHEPRLHRSLGRIDVALFFIITGSNLQWVATAAAAGPSAITVWIIGALAMFVPIAVVVVYLSSRFPAEGGMYIWTKRAFGPFAGFLTGWTYWMSNVPYFPALLYFAAGNALFIGGAGRSALATSPAYFAAVSIGGLALGTVVNIFGLDVGKWLNNVGAISRWTATLVLVGLGAVVAYKFGSTTAIDSASLRPGLALKDIIFWSVIAYAWTGPEALSFMAGEVKNPRRAIPAGVAIAAPVTAAIYILGTISVLIILKPGDVNASSGVMQAISGAATRIGWPILTPIAAVLVVISCLGSVGAWLGAVARLPFVAGIDHYLPAQFGRMHPRWNSPVTALVTQAIVAAIFVVLGQGGTTVKGAYDVLVSTTVITTMIPFVLLFASAIKLAFAPGGAPSIRIPGGGATIVIASAVGLLTTCVSMVLAAFPADDDPNKALAVLKILILNALMVGSGIAVFRIGGRRKNAQRNGRRIA